MLIALIISLICGLGLGVWYAHYAQQQTIKHDYSFSSTPTIFVHGWTGTGKSEEPLFASAQNLKIAKRHMIIYVRSNGKLRIKGHLNNKMKNPIVQVIFKNNRAGEVKDAHWLMKIMRVLKTTYHVKRYNAVGHSMGSYAWVYYNMLVGNNAKYPRLERAVLIGGPYDGIINNHKLNQPQNPPLSKLWDGRPKIIHPEYQKLLDIRSRFPKQARVLNIYGDLLDGSNSDGVITIPSARSLAYLIKNEVTSYHELRVTGANAQHSKLHEYNLTVNKALTNFLWGRNKAIS
ncbi:hypothetical protein FC82_GL000312 [Secundilactobacillus collinoides DSM 20515 = JCM 1123]|uniref:Cell surface hydrolase n=1 Tax=Secundilactobacillus collinoides DSM 20515 = JCM 1123 TaxID=1423733 RepID=A0A0R2B5B4_SECCO|nr:hypothetical protein FC82_GL000312 [Secundilactobacillus collinoides DSM 20515 = JCM 1123]